MGQLGRRHPAWANIFPEIIPQQEIAPSRSRALERSTVEKPNFSVLTAPARNVQTAELSFATIHSHGSLFVDFMRARHAVFKKGKGWDLPEKDGMEFDQYDNGFTRWIALHEYGKVIGGVRLYPTTEKVGLCSYMLRDAQLGLLDGLRQDFLYDQAPVSSLILEATRLFVVSDVPSTQRAAVQLKLMTAMADTARRQNATHIIGIVPAVFRRWLARLGLSATPVGPELENDGDRVRAALFRAEDFKQ